MNPTIQPTTTDYSLYLFRFSGIAPRSIPCTVVLIGFDLIFTLIGLVIGSSNVSSCPIEPRIPIYLIVIATVNLLVILLKSISIVIRVKKFDENLLGFFFNFFSAITISISLLFSFIWLIIGSVWLFSVVSRVQFNKTDVDNYCQANVYQYTFVSIILQYIVPFIICCCQNLPLK